MPSKYANEPNEAQVSSEIVGALKLLGFTEPIYDSDVGFFLRTEQKGRHKMRNHESAGIPDLLVRRNEWAEGMWLGLEIKGRDRLMTLKPAQEVLKTRAGICIVQSVGDALRAIEGVDDDAI